MCAYWHHLYFFEWLTPSSGTFKPGAAFAGFFAKAAPGLKVPLDEFS